MQIPPQIVQLLIWRNGKKKKESSCVHIKVIFLYFVWLSLFLLLSYFLFESHLHLHGIEAFFDGQGVRERGIAHIFFGRNFFCTFCHPQFFVQTDRHFFHM